MAGPSAPIVLRERPTAKPCSPPLDGSVSVKRHPELPPLRHEELPPPLGS